MAVLTEEQLERVAIEAEHLPDDVAQQSYEERVAALKIHAVLAAYTQMALGLYCSKFSREEAEFGIVSNEWATVERVVPVEADRICEVRGITRRQFMHSLAFPRPTYIQNLVFCSELFARFGEFDAPGFKAGRLEVPRTYGMFIPIWSNDMISELKFHSMSTLVKPVNGLTTEAA